MKKLTSVCILVASLAVTSGFSQGTFLFTTGKSQVWDGFTTAATTALSSKVAVSFLWAPASTATPMPISQSLQSGNSSTSTSYTAAQAWAAILSGSDTWTVAQNANSANAEVRAVTAANGFISYGSSFAVTGTAETTAYTIMMVSYDSQYASLLAASTAGSAVGWSTAFAYTSSTALGAPVAFTGSAAQFGTFIPAAVPEPGTIALAGLGGLGLLALRRRNK